MRNEELEDIRKAEYSCFCLLDLLAYLSIRLSVFIWLENCRKESDLCGKHIRN